MDNKKLFWTATTMREEIPVSRPTIYRWLNTPGFPSVRVGRKYLIPKEEALAWIKANKEGKLGRSVR